MDGELSILRVEEKIVSHLSKVLDEEYSQIIEACDEYREMKYFNMEMEEAASSGSPLQASAKGEIEHIWSKDVVKLLLDLYMARKALFRDPQMRKKDLWQDITLEMERQGYKISEQALNRKFRNLKKTYTAIKNKQKRSRSDVISWEYFQIFEAIFGGISPFGREPKNSPSAKSDSPSSLSSFGNDGDFFQTDMQHKIEFERLDDFVHFKDEVCTEDCRKTGSESESQRWSEQQTQLLIDLYLMRSEEFHDKNKLKRDVWRKVSTDMRKHGYHLTEEALGRKWRNLKKTYKEVRENHKKHKTGNNVKWKYFNILAEIFGDNCTTSQGTAAGSFAALTAPCSPITDFASSDPLDVVSESSEVVNLKRRLLAIEQERTDSMRQLSEKFDRYNAALEESNRIQRDRNELLKQLISNVLN